MDDIDEICRSNDNLDIDKIDKLAELIRETEKIPYLCNENVDYGNSRIRKQVWVKYWSLTDKQKERYRRYARFILRKTNLIKDITEN
jgi:hypothetical protein